MTQHETMPSVQRTITAATDYRSFLRAIKRGAYTIDQLTGETDRPEKLRALVELMGEKYETSLIRAFDNDHVDQTTGEVLWVEHKKKAPAAPSENGEPKLAGTGSDVLPPPPAPPVKKTPEEIQAAVDAAVEKHGANILDRADGNDILASYGLKRDEVTERMVERADSRVQKKLRETFAKANDKVSNRGKVVWDGDEQLDPAINPDHPIRGAAAVTREREEREKAATRERLNGLRSKNSDNGDGESRIIPQGDDDTFTFEGENTMRLSEKAARTLLVSAGVEAKTWGVKKLTAALNDQERLVEANEPEDEKQKERFTAVLKAVADGKKITVTEGAGSPSTNGTHKKEGAAAPKEKKPKGPGVIDTIQEVLQKASESKPASKEKILEVLVKRFPDRDPKGMASSIGMVKSDMKKRGFEVKKNEKGMWI